MVRDGQVGRLDSQGYPGLVFNQTNLTFVLKQRETETTERSSINNTGLAGAASEGTARLTVLRPQVVHSRQRMGPMGSPWDKAGSREGSTMDTTLEKRIIAVDESRHPDRRLTNRQEDRSHASAEQSIEQRTCQNIWTSQDLRDIRSWQSLQ